MRLTDEQVREIKDRAEKATSGPWRRSVVRSKLGGEDCLWVGPDHFNLFAVPIGRTPKDHAGALCDAEFSAHARTDIPALLADREALVAENAKLRRVVEAAQKLRPMFNLVADEEIELDDALSALEAANVLDATDDKG